MTGPMFMVFGILAGAIVLFAWGRRPRVVIVAILVVLALMLSWVLTRVKHWRLWGSGRCSDRRNLCRPVGPGSCNVWAEAVMKWAAMAICRR
jgi:hypothetical protein